MTTNLPPQSDEFKRFAELTKKLAAVPKSAVDAERAKD